ncbi:MAG TPA: hypothetical protein VFJ51_05500 [Nitrososphaeraceae archaeon]|nr:hypothetical protein [Nitrososphaeraceae archaeon]
MKLTALVLVFAGSFVVLLGLLWLLQGAAIIHICPVLCVANCECVSSGSRSWEIAGAITFVIGVTIIVADLRLIF